MSLYKLSKGRCWAGYEPVPGKEAYSDGSCRPVGSKKKKKDKKKEKSASSSSLMDKLNVIKFNYTQPKQASLEDLNTERFVKLLDLK